jgi:hypothetical protein
MAGKDNVIEIIIQNLEMDDDWDPSIRSSLKSWIRKYYRENPSGGTVIQDLKELIESIYSLQQNKNSEGAS